MANDIWRAQAAAPMNTQPQQQMQVQSAAQVVPVTLPMYAPAMPTGCASCSQRGFGCGGGTAEMSHSGGCGCMMGGGSHAALILALLVVGIGTGLAVYAACRNQGMDWSD